jgi:DNA-binding transcriptional MerR regulator
LKIGEVAQRGGVSLQAIRYLSECPILDALEAKGALA